MTTKTIYIKDENAETWRKAERFIEAYEKKSLSQFLFEHLQSVVDKYEPIADELERLEQQIAALKAKAGIL